MMERMTKIHVNGSILCFLKLQLRSWLSKQSNDECCALRSGCGSVYGGRGGQGGHQLLLLFLSLDFLICRPGIRALTCRCKIQMRIKIVNNSCEVKAPPLSCSLLIKRQKGYFVASPHQMKIHKKGGFPRCGL